MTPKKSHNKKERSETARLQVHFLAINNLYYNEACNFEIMRILNRVKKLYEQ